VEQFNATRSGDQMIDANCCTFSHTMAVAQTLHSAKQISLGAYSTFRATLAHWITGYITCARLWLPRLTLLPFAIGLLEDPIRGPALARALIRRTWRDHPVEAAVGFGGGADCKERACMFQSSLIQIHKNMGGFLQRGSPPFIVRLRVTPTYQKEVVAKAGYSVCWYFRGA
jgi:hypothetical protein